MEVDVFLILFLSVASQNSGTRLHASRALRLAHTGREHNMPTGFDSPGARNGMAWLFVRDKKFLFRSLLL